MIKLYLDSTSAVMIDVLNPCITHKFDGHDILTFDISPYAEHYKDMAEESTLFYEGAFYIVKKIDERQDISSIECDLCLDDLKAECFNYESTEQTLSYVLSQLVLHTSGWIYTNSATITISRSVELLENVNILDVLEYCADVYSCQFQFDNVTKTIDVIKYEINEPTGAYFTDELNLKDISFKGDSTEFCTRLIGYGKKDEETGLYLTFESVNGGLNYVENHTYSDKIITKAFIDERFTDAQSLKAEAVARLALLAAPKRSYECTVADLAKINPDYENILSVSVYDVVTLIDRRRNTRINHMIMEYVEYPESPESNVITLSSVVQTLTGTVTKVNQIINNTGTLQVNGISLNEFKRDIDSNSLSITNMYTKDQSDTVLQSAIQQSAEETLITVNEQIALKSAIYTTAPDTFVENDVFYLDKEYIGANIEYEVGTPLLALVSQTESLYQKIKFANGDVLTFVNGGYPILPNLDSVKWDKKDNYQTETDVSNIFSVKSDETLNTIRNGGLTSNVRFGNDGVHSALQVYNGDIEIYSEPYGASGNQKVFYIDNNTGELISASTMTDFSKSAKAKIGTWTENLEGGGTFTARGLALYDNTDTLFGYLQKYGQGISLQIPTLATGWGMFRINEDNAVMQRQFSDTNYGTVYHNSSTTSMYRKFAVNNYGEFYHSATFTEMTRTFSTGTASLLLTSTVFQLDVPSGAVIGGDDAVFNCYSDRANFADLYTNGVKVTSDRKLKKDISQNKSYALEKLSSVNFYSYTINKPIKDKDGKETGKFDNGYKTDIGLMTDECPSEIVADNGEYQSIDLYASISMSIKAIQELSKKVERLTNRVESLEIENAELKKQMTRQKQINNILTKRSVK